MKKLLIVMICMLCVAATLDTLRSMDSVPGNKNILNLELLHTELNQPDSTVTTLAPIPVETGASYTLSMPASIGSDVSVRLSGNNDSDVYVDEQLDEAGGLCSNPGENFLECTFEPSHADLDIEIHGGEGLTQHLFNFEEMGHPYDGFQLEKGTVRTDYIPFEPLLDAPPEFAGEKDLFVSYASDVPLETILSSNIEVHDAIDGEIPTEALTVQHDAYTGNETTVGAYTVTIEASDSSGNTSVLDLLIHVRDHKAPVIEGPDSVKADVNDAMTAEAIIEDEFTVIDGHDGVIDTHRITADTHTGKHSELGEGSVTFEVEDASGNTARHTFTVTVEDVDAPAITGADTLTMKQSDMRTLEEVFGEYSVSDNHDAAGDVTFTIDGGGYSADAASGDYELTLQATDSSANSTQKSVTLTVEDDIPPRLYGLSTKRMSYTETFDLESYIASMTPTDNDDTTMGAASIVHTGTDYVENTPGNYTHTFEVADASGNTATHTLKLIVIDDVAPEFDVVASVLAYIDEPLDEDTIQSMIMRDESLQAFTPVSYTVMEDGYTDHKDEEGEYLYTVEYSNAEGETTVRSLEIQVASIVEDESTVPYGPIAAVGGLTLLGIAVWIKRRR